VERRDGRELEPATIGQEEPEKKNLKYLLTTNPAHANLTSDMGRNVLITIEIPLSLREKVRANWKRNGVSLKNFYSELFKIGVKTNEESERLGDKVSNLMGKN